MDNKADVIKIAAGVVVFCACLVGFFATRNKPQVEGKKKSKLPKLFFVGAIIGAWFAVGALIAAFSGLKNVLCVEFQMFSERVDVFGISLAKTTLVAVCVTVFLTVLLVLFRIFAVPHFSVDSPKTLQNVIEMLIEAVDSMVTGTVGASAAKQLSPYMASIALFMIGCALTELLGLRAPTSDLTCTLAMGLCTFALLNIYGIKRHGVFGRLKAMGGQVAAMRPVMIPLKAVSDIAVPVSLACRLFGNMLGGMLVMELLKGVLGGYASGLPAIAGLYFNLFHPLIQMYIFITLSLTFINEAME